MKKGFTLIELLAVIVILAIIALIATPIVLNIINDTKESAVIRSADFYIDALENEIMLENMKQGGNFNPNTCTIVNKVISCDGKEIKLKVDGEVPTNGTIKFEEGKVTGVNLTYPNGTVTLDNKGELVLGENTENTVKTLKDLAVVSEKLGVNSIDTCATSGTCEPGTPFAIKVNDNETYKFYVLSESEDLTSMTLIMSSNLYADGNTTNPNVAWLSRDDYQTAGGNETQMEYYYGPLTALKVLKERTSDWANIKEFSYELEETLYANWYLYSGDYVQNVRARMISLIDLETFCTNSGVDDNFYCDNWLLDGLNDTGDDNTYGYWLTSLTVNPYWALYIRNNVSNNVGSADMDEATKIGIRPVITIPTGKKPFENGIMLSRDNCINDGKCAAGTAIYVKVNDKKTYKFYVLDDSDNKLTLIMATNLYAEGDTTNPNVAWLSQSDYEAAGGQGSQPESYYGPITALKVLKERTKNWTNILQYSYELNYGQVSNNYVDYIEGKYSGEYVQNIRARMPKLTDFTTTGICLNYNCPDWISEGQNGTGDNNTYGYWLSDGADSTFAYQVVDSHITSYQNCDIYDDMYNGIRPVITITK